MRLKGLNFINCIYEFKEKQKSHHYKVEEQEEEPPDDFRQISVYPTSQEVTNLECSFVRRNKVEGSYRDVNEYLDIQFRLLREDFVAPLRQGVCEYIKQSIGGSERKKIFTVKVHPRVRFVGTQNVRDLLGVKVIFSRSNS